MEPTEESVVCSNDLAGGPNAMTTEPLSMVPQITDTTSMVPQITDTTPQEKETIARVGISWNIVSGFSFEALRKTYKTHAPTTWHLLWKFVAPKSVKKCRRMTARVY
ncbi:hypothetical protein HETIRDRAFT_325164 [Heterobasidion irregulare TC 32-1]|uniref:Uncharacterized protein n=1 Tax=Heterobasidion irregulare (strain TC 32-1) TaxID=747525 RepID=W4JYE4_HETIT|nr:uncharacterized protein HETIRDRAFT_325164 [Heterobasidion irregulare TC 32-1]ETW77876.1 hypothetical protein HETIRDRAFT_325164 [Heterobasidion irregulare TC 32-1]